MRAASIRAAVHALALLVCGLVPVAEGQDAAPSVRTFPAFAGTWVLDEAASTGELRIGPRIPASMTIAITPTAITVTKQPRLLPNDRSSASPPPEVYRLDGSETEEVDPRTGVTLQRSYRFTLVADMLALTIKEGRPSPGGFTLVTDAYAVDGDVLTLHRQLSAVTAAGEILVMQQPANNSRHTFIYRRAPSSL